MEIILTAAASFAATNLDDILILTLLFSQAETRPDRLRIIAGQ